MRRLLVVLMLLVSFSVGADEIYMDEAHPLKKTLDEIFGKGRITYSSQSLRDAGFQRVAKEAWYSVDVVRHPALSGYLIKCYTDVTDKQGKTATVEYSGTDQLEKRARMARKIQELIDEHNIKDIVVPKKWVYRLPDEFPPPKLAGQSESMQKRVILVVEEMPICDLRTTRDFYKKKVTLPQLERLVFLLKESGFNDTKLCNMPVTKNGKIALIDTARCGINFAESIDYFKDDVHERGRKFLASIAADWRKAR